MSKNKRKINEAVTKRSGAIAGGSNNVDEAEVKNGLVKGIYGGAGEGDTDGMVRGFLLSILLY